MVSVLQAQLVTAVTYRASADALEMVQSGYTVYLADGIYVGAKKSLRVGDFNSPITIEGTRDAIIIDHSHWRSVVNTFYWPPRQSLLFPTSNRYSGCKELDNLQVVTYYAYLLKMYIEHNRSFRERNATEGVHQIEHCSPWDFRY